LVGISAGLASAGKKPYAASPASFLTMRSIEQVKVDVAYSNANVKLIGISAGVSYGALGMTHHSLQDLAVLTAIPNMQIIVPADQYETRKMMTALQNDTHPTYIRVSRNPVEDVHENENFDYEIGKAITLREGDDLAIVACGDMVSIACHASDELQKQGIHARVINMHTIKPFDEEAIIDAAKNTKGIITMEEHSVYGGLGAMVCECIAQNHPIKVRVLAFPDEITTSGTAQELFDYYGLSVENVVKVANEML
jgi:transketolase